MAKDWDYIDDVLPLKNKLFRWTLRFVPHQEEAEDIVADVMAKAWEQRDKLKQVDAVEAFLMTSCRNLALNRLQRREMQNLSLEDSGAAFSAASPEASAQEQMERRERREIIARLMRQLPEKQQRALHHREVEHMAYAEISKVMNESEANVKVLISRARKSLKEAIIKIDNHELSIH